MASTSRTAARRRARVKALQGLYQWDLNQAAGNDPDSEEIARQFHTSQDMDGVDETYFEELLNGSIAGLEKLDTALASSLDRPVLELDPIERSICRLGAYELAERHDVPLRVVINEWVEISKRFGSDQGFKYVNGVMDKLGVCLREPESKALRQSASKPGSE